MLLIVGASMMTAFTVIVCWSEHGIVCVTVLGLSFLLPPTLHKDAAPMIRSSNEHGTTCFLHDCANASKEQSLLTERLWYNKYFFHTTICFSILS